MMPQAEYEVEQERSLLLRDGGLEFRVELTKTGRDHERKKKISHTL